MATLGFLNVSVTLQQMLMRLKMLKNQQILLAPVLSHIHHSSLLVSSICLHKWLLPRLLIHQRKVSKVWFLIVFYMSLMGWLHDTPVWHWIWCLWWHQFISQPECHICRVSLCFFSRHQAENILDCSSVVASYLICPGQYCLSWVVHNMCNKVTKIQTLRHDSYILWITVNMKGKTEYFGASAGWMVNTCFMWCTYPVSTVLQFQLVSEWGRSVLLSGPLQTCHILSSVLLISRQFSRLHRSS